MHKKTTAIIILAILLSNIILITQVQPTHAQMFVNNLFMVTPSEVSVSYSTAFSLTVTNLLNDSIWVFCLADANITREDAPIFLTINAAESYVFRFVSPQQTNQNIDLTNFTDANSALQQAQYSIYFGAVNYDATAFQTAQISLTMSSVESLTYQLTVLYQQNQQLMRQLLAMQDKAGLNNGLIIAAVVSNIFWACLFLGVQLSKRKTIPYVTEEPATQPLGSQV